ncbi:hypothetical protein [Phaeobacter phage MD18]|nr:hypothetical protein [Phaeobacter phage MD18]
MRFIGIVSIIGILGSLAMASVAPGAAFAGILGFGVVLAFASMGVRASNE